MAMPLNILIVEDSPDDAELMVAQLRRDGFDPVWRRVETEADFLAELKKLPAIVRSDYALPQFNGWRAAQLVLVSGLNIPFILISGTVGEDADVEAMKRGATDYLLKDRLSRLGNAVARALEQKRLRDDRLQTEEELRWKTTLLEAQLESSLDGILVVDSQGRKVLQNRRMAEMWKLPQSADGQPPDDVVAAAFDPDREKYPQQFIEKVAYLQTHPDEASHDVIELIDGSILDRYSGRRKRWNPLASLPAASPMISTIFSPPFSAISTSPKWMRRIIQTSSNISTTFRRRPSARVISSPKSSPSAAKTNRNGNR